MGTVPEVIFVGTVPKVWRNRKSTRAIGDSLLDSVTGGSIGSAAQSVSTTLPRNHNGVRPHGSPSRQQQGDSPRGNLRGDSSQGMAKLEIDQSDRRFVARLSYRWLNRVSRPVGLNHPAAGTITGSDPMEVRHANNRGTVPEVIFVGTVPKVWRNRKSTRAIGDSLHDSVTGGSIGSAAPSVSTTLPRNHNGARPHGCPSRQRHGDSPRGDRLGTVPKVRRNRKSWHDMGLDPSETR